MRTQLNMSARREGGCKNMKIYIFKEKKFCTKLYQVVTQKVGGFPNTLTSFVSSSLFLCENAQEIG